MKHIGLTGGIGSGKSFIAQIIEHMGYPVYYSDARAKELTKSNPTIKMGLISLFGEEVFEGNQLNAELISSRIFHDDELLKQVNELIHPIVRADFENWVLNQNSALVFNEAAILFETGSYQNFDSTILVCAPTESKIERVMKRENCSREVVLERMNKQWPDEDKMKLTDYSILNDNQNPVLIHLETIINDLMR
jgi:dephospho-CoA kinase